MKTRVARKGLIGVGQMIERIGRLEEISKKAEGLTVTSAKFQKKAVEVHNVMWWKNKKFIFVIIIVVLVRRHH